MRRRRILGLGLVVAVPFMGTDPAATQDARVLADPIAFGGTADRDAVFSWTDPQGRVALLNLVVSTAPGQKGRLEAEFFAVRRGVRTKLGPRPERKYPRRRPALFTNHSKPIELRQNTLNLVRLRLGIAAGGSPAAADGVLRLRLPGVKVDKKRVAPILIKTKGRFPKLTAQPDKVSLGITRQWGFLSSVLCKECAWNDEQTIELHGQGAGNFVVAGRAGAEATLRGDRNGDLDVTLTPKEGKRPRVREVEVNAGDIEHVGDYSGEIRLGRASEGTEAIPVTVKVQDWFLWPFFVLLLGAALGGYLMQRYDIHRNRDLHRSALKRAVGRREEIDRLAERAGVYGADDLLGPPDRRYPGRKACDIAADRARLPALWCEIHQTAEDDEFVGLTAAVNAFIDDLERRWALVEAAAELRDALDALPRNATPEIAKLADSLLLDIRDEPPDDRADEEALTKMLRGHARVFQKVKAIFVAATLVHRPAEWVEGEIAEAAVPYSGRLLSDPEAVDDLRQDLAGLLERIVSGQTDELEDVRVVHGPRFAFAGGVGDGRGLLRDLRGGRPAVEEEQDRRTPEQIVSALRRWDLWRAVVTVLVTAVAALLPIYVGENFGTWDDYLTVFAAGFLGQAVGKVAQAVAFNWSLFPALRSYRLRPGQPKPPAGGDAAA